MIFTAPTQSLSGARIRREDGVVISLDDKGRGTTDMEPGDHRVEVETDQGWEPVEVQVKPAPQGDTSRREDAVDLEFEGDGDYELERPIQTIVQGIVIIALVIVAIFVVHYFLVELPG